MPAAGVAEGQARRAGERCRRGHARPAAIIRPVTPLLIGAAGLVALVAGGLVLRTFGGAFRIGRLLATTPEVTVDEANAIAAAGRKAYVRIAGRIDAEDEFEDADHRPLVFRRVRLEARVGRGWHPFEDHRQAVPFSVNEGLATIAIDVDALDAGLIVVPRESVGRAADMPDRVPAGHAADTPVRARIEQISSVEHAIVVGYPIAVEGGTTGPTTTSATPDATVGESATTPSARMTAGRGRPLILTVLEPDEAMRILAGGDAGRTRLAAGLLGAGAILIVGALAWAGVTALLPAIITLVPDAASFVASAFAASGDPSVAVGAGDPRSNGQGPGLVGTPGLAIVGVLAIAVVAILATTIYVRMTAPSSSAGRSDPGRRTGPSSSPGRRRRR
jgi:hypothetical protein